MKQPEIPAAPSLRAQWRSALDHLPRNRRFPEVRCFARFCEKRGVAPEAVDEATVEAYARRLYEKGYADAAKRARALRHQLNAARASPAWPGPPVTAPTKPDRTRVHRPLAAFTAAFQQALADLEGELHAPTRVPPERAHSVVDASTARKAGQRVRESASLLVDIGLIDIQALSSPQELLAVDRLTALVTCLQTRVAPTHVRNYAKALIPVCRVYFPRGSPPEQVLHTVMRRQPVETPTIIGTPTEKLLTLLDGPAHDRLTAFPDHAFAQAAEAPGALAKRAWSKAGAIVVIALSAPLNTREIAGLRVADVAPDGRITRIKAPDDPPDRAYPVPATAAAYLAHHGRNLPAWHPTTPLMPGVAQGPMSAQSLTTLVEQYVQPVVGVPVTPQMLYMRHLALLLRDDPGAIDRVLAWARLTGAPHSRQRLRLLAQLWQPAA